MGAGAGTEAGGVLLEAVTGVALPAGLAAFMVAGAGAEPRAAAYDFLSAGGAGVMRAACRGPTFCGGPSAGWNTGMVLSSAVARRLDSWRLRLRLMLPSAAASTFFGAGAGSVGYSVELLDLLLPLFCSCWLAEPCAEGVVLLLAGFCRRGWSSGASMKPACSFSSFLSPRPGTRAFMSSQLAKGPFADRWSKRR